MNPSNREPARERFATLEHFLDLNEATRQLLQEPSAETDGHRQIALHKTSHTTIALFAFRAGGGLPEHQAHGAVIIQTLEGRLRVAASKETYILGAGNLLVLAPDVPHDVTAEVDSKMLLTVSLAPPKI